MADQFKGTPLAFDASDSQIQLAQHILQLLSDPATGLSDELSLDIPVPPPPPPLPTEHPPIINNQANQARNDSIEHPTPKYDIYEDYTGESSYCSDSDSDEYIDLEDTAPQKPTLIRPDTSTGVLSNNIPSNPEPAEVTNNLRPAGLASVTAENLASGGLIPLYTLGGRNKASPLSETNSTQECFAILPESVVKVSTDSPNTIHCNSGITSDSGKSTINHYVIPSSDNSFEIADKKNSLASSLHTVAIGSPSHCPEEYVPSEQRQSERLLPAKYRTSSPGFYIRPMPTVSSDEPMPQHPRKPAILNPNAVYAFSFNAAGQNCYSTPVPTSPLPSPYAPSAPPFPSGYFDLQIPGSTMNFPYPSNSKTSTSLAPSANLPLFRDLNSRTIKFETNCKQTAGTEGEVFVNQLVFTAPVFLPIQYHWFFNKELEGNASWQPFSKIDSKVLEESYLSFDVNSETTVPTDGGRFDVNLQCRKRFPVYWNSGSNEVRRCSWFVKGYNDGRFTPFAEDVADLLENEYQNAVATKEWNRKLKLLNGETVLMVSSDVLLLFSSSYAFSAWGSDHQSDARPRVIKRGIDAFTIEEGESEQIDHLLFVVHGIGSVCDLKLHSVEQVADEFRNISKQLINSHYLTSFKKGVIHRIEVLPISWHSKLHSGDTGIDQKLKNITLNSIPRLRDFTNDTLLDVLLYTSPLYCQNIVSSVGNELNRIYEMFKLRNASFHGSVSLGGHSLGSLILFDILCHQDNVDLLSTESTFDKALSSEGVKNIPERKSFNRRISSLLFEAGSDQPQLVFPQLIFQPKALFAMGSPIGMFLTIRGLDKLGNEFSLPTCPAFFNIFHPYDPVAYRVESLINPQLGKLKPVLIPHHKGRKRMHLELKDTVSRVGADLKQKLLDSMKTTLNTLFQMGLFTKADEDASFLDIDEDQDEQIILQDGAKEIPNLECLFDQSTDLCFGMLNRGRRIDYVLQEAPFEIVNEYIFALTSHVCYWESEDTILLILKEMYNSLGVYPDCQMLQLKEGGTTTKSQSSFSDGCPHPSQLNQYPGIQNSSVQTDVEPAMPLPNNPDINSPSETDNTEEDS